MPTPVYILGAGALGRLWAARLSAAGWQPVLLLRNQLLPAEIIDQPLWLPGETLPHCYPIEQQTCDHPTPIAQLLVCTKAGQTLEAIASIKHRLEPNASILVLQNGLGTQQQLAEQLTPRSVWAASTTDGAWLDEDRGVHHAGAGITRIGPLTEGPVPPWIAQLPTVGGLKIERVDSIEPVLLEKVAINSAINGLTALYDCRNGALLDEPYWSKVNALCSETEQLLQKLGQPLATPLAEQVRRVLQLTAQNFSSSCQDQRAGRPTELDAINGYLLRQAEPFGLELATHRWLMEQLQTND